MVRVALAALSVSWAVSGLATAQTEESSSSARPLVILDVADRGQICLELLSDSAPDTAANFLQLVRDRFYDGLSFHRVERWVVQGGCPKGDGTGGPPWRIDLEPTTHPNTRGAVGMAREGQDRNSAGSQFYILKADARHLDGEYAVFAVVRSGLEVADAIVAGDRIATASESPTPPVGQ